MPGPPAPPAEGLAVSFRVPSWYLADMAKPNPSRTKKPALSDADRHERFIATAKEIGADEDAATFDRVFAKITSPAPSKP